MTIDTLLVWLAAVNPGLFMMAAGVAAVAARGGPARVACLVGGPLVALAALLFAELGLDLATVDVMGLRLVLYRVDSLSFVFALAFALAGVLQGVYSLHRADPLQDASGLIYAGAAMAGVLAGDIFTLFIFWELTALASAALLFAQRTEAAYRAGLRYLVFQLVSGLLLLSGAMILNGATGASTFVEMAGFGAPPLVGALGLHQPGAVLILLAFGVKAAFPLLHTWLPDAYPRASETGAVILSAFTTKLAVYALARCFAGEDALVWIGLVMAIFPLALAVREDDLRRVLAYSLINQVGMMVCAVGVGSQLALNGAAAHAFASVIYQTLLFMALGAVLLRTGTANASELGGLHRTMPHTTLACMVGSASIAAAPLAAGFVAKSLSFSAVEGAYPEWVNLLLLAASAGVTALAALRLPYAAFFAADSGRRPQEAPFNMLLAMGLSAFLTLSIGLEPGWLFALLPYPELALDYLAHDLWTFRHVLEQVQLIGFAALAFFLLKDRGLLPAETAGSVADIDWLWRRGVSALGRRTARARAWMAAALGRGLVGLRGRANPAAGAVLAPGGGWSRRAPLEATAVAAGLVLAAVLFFVAVR
jgi:multicomponent Na+:H+ antiporter subunit D